MGTVTAKRIASLGSLATSSGKAVWAVCGDFAPSVSVSLAPRVAEQGVEHLRLLQHRVMRGTAERHQAGVDAPGEGTVLRRECPPLPGCRWPGQLRVNGRIPGPNGGQLREPARGQGG